ncbi:MAG: DNA repair protein RadC [Sphingomonadaceae bacterium]
MADDDGDAAREPQLSLVPPVPQPSGASPSSSPRKARDPARPLSREEVALVRSHSRVRISAKDLNQGHRQRLLKRLYEVGHEGLAEHEILEGLLFQFIPRIDTKPIAKRLLLEFGDLLGVLTASIDDLRDIEGLGPQSAVGLKFVHATAVRAMRREAVRSEKGHQWHFANLDDVIGYIRLDQGARIIEQFRVLYLTTRNRLIRDEVPWEGSVNHAPAYPARIIKRALELGASAIILVHNHPSGDPEPSRDDIALTHAIVSAGAPHGIAVHDHLIVARDRHVSLRALGFIR